MQTPSNFCYNVRRKGEKAQNNKDNNKERTKKMAQEIKIGDWFYRMMGYGGSESQWCCVIGKTEEKTGAHMFSLFGGKDGGMRPLPVSEVYIAIDERGVEHRISANDLKENGSIGIGSLKADEYGHRATICREDARLLVETGAYTEEEIAAEFPYAFKTWEEEEKDERPGAPMTAKQVEIYRAVKVANEEKQKRETEEKIFPSYVLIKMTMTDESWHVVRNIRGVTGFVGPGSRPTPLTEEEVEALAVETRTVSVSFDVGSKVKICAGLFEGYRGIVQEFSDDKKEVTVLVKTERRDMPIRLETKDIQADNEL